MSGRLLRRDVDGAIRRSRADGRRPGRRGGPRSRRLAASALGERQRWRPIRGLMAPSMTGVRPADHSARRRLAAGRKIAGRGAERQPPLGAGNRPR